MCSRMKAAVFLSVVSLLLLTVSCCRSNVTSSGTRQSPIDINTSEAKQRNHIIDRIYPLRIDCNYTDDSAVRVYKDNYTVKLVPRDTSNGCRMSGGPLRGDAFILNEVHFHWGVDNLQGSEHTVNSTQFSMEAHLVFFKQQYGSPQEALMQADGLAVIGIFIEAGAESNPNFQNVTEIINRSAGSDEEFNSTGAEAYNWFPATFVTDSLYYTYMGSLTTPPFSENVQWIVFGFVVPISSAQIELFRQLTFQGKPLTPNWRETQPLNKRRVSSSKNYKLRRTPRQ